MTRRDMVCPPRWYQRKPSPMIATLVPEDAHVANDGRPVVIDDARSQRELDDELGAWRESAARAAGILPDAICSTAILKAIAEQRPASADDLARLSGMGMLTANRLYPGIAQVLEADQSRRSTSTGA